ncbi:MAG: hypothetical protein QM820_08695 [Minicystis sp.]
MAQSRGWSLDPLCFNSPNDKNNLQIVAGQPVYLCVALSEIFGTNLYGAQPYYNGTPLGPPQDIPARQSRIWAAGPFTFTSNPHYRITGNSHDAAGVEYVTGVSGDYADLSFVSPQLTVQKTASTDGTCPGQELGDGALRDQRHLLLHGHQHRRRHGQRHHPHRRRPARGLPRQPRAGAERALDRFGSTPPSTSTPRPSPPAP